MMLRRRVDVLLAIVVAVALLAALPLFALGRDLTPVRMVTPDYLLRSAGACVTEKGFLLQWNSETRAYITTADAAGVPRVPAISTFPSTGELFRNGDGCLAISQNGIVELDAGGVVRRNVTFDGAPLFFSKAAFDGTNFFLLDSIVGAPYRGRIVDRNGHVLSTTKLPISAAVASDSTSHVTASADGGFTVVVAGAEAGVFALLISAAGQVTARVDFFPPGIRGGYLVTAASNAHQTVVAWTMFGSFFVHTVALRGGSVIGDSILPPTIERSSSIELLPSGDGFILLRNAYVFGTPALHYFGQATRLDATGAPREASTTLFEGGVGAAAATSRTLVFLSSRDASLIEVSAAITDSGIVPSAPYDIVATAVQQLAPAVASDGVDFFATWLETASKTMTVMAGRVTRSGLPLDGTGLVVAESPSTSINRPFGSPSVAFGGGVYLVVFPAGPYPAHYVMGRRYARDGTPIDPAPFVITANGSATSLAFGGGRFLVAWQLPDGHSIAGATVAIDGSVGGQVLLTPAPSQAQLQELGYAGQPMIGWNGRHFIVAYDLAEQGGYPYSRHARVLRASPLGAPLEAHTIDAVFGGSGSALACSDQECLVSSVRADGLVTAVVHDDATLHTDAPKIVANLSYGAIAFDGASYILAWRTGDSLLGLARVSRGGEPYALAVAGKANANTSLLTSLPALAANSAGDTAIVTSEFNTVWLIDRARFYLASELFAIRRRAIR